MSRIIAGIYEIQEQIGAGGGGIVYRGRHLRLDKQIVLKADRRTLNTKSEVLRREVDMLKNLSHTYIPQVYDFVQDQGIVYTVMDFIEGESLDKLLIRGQTISQPQVIQWACQLLEALCYLHSRPPHGILHGDIKPANIILRPGGDICLIDYNIALALGEDGAVKVGFSRGYASPEHYGQEYGTGEKNASFMQKAAFRSNIQKNGSVTETMTADDTETDRVPASTPGRSSTGKSCAVRLDVRSDIYSLGATLYHLLSGERPLQNAVEVRALGSDVCSMEVSAIIQKAMMPDPKMRYQSAQDMLTAFLQLHKKDRRVVRHRRRAVITGTVLTGMFLMGGMCSFAGLKQLEQMQTALALAEYSADHLASGDRSGAVKMALEAIPREKGLLEAPVTAQAQKALTDALGVYDLSDGFKDFETVMLPSAPFKIMLSPQGGYVAAVYSKEAVVYRTESGEEVLKLQMQNSALADLIFVDETKILYAGKQGVSLYSLDENKTLWVSGEATMLALSGDRTLAAAVNRDENRVAIYRVSDGVKVMERSFEGRHMTVAVNDIFADPDNDIFTMNHDGSLLAVSFSDGSLMILDLRHPEDDLILYDMSDYNRFEGGFCGSYFAFAASGNGQSQFGLIDTGKALYVGGYDTKNNLRIQVKEDGIYLASGSLLEHVDPNTLKETELAYTENVNITSFAVCGSDIMVATDDNCFSFYDGGANKSGFEACREPCDFVVLSDGYAAVANRSEASLRLLKRENHEEAQLLSYDARYSHDEARISQKYHTAVLFQYQGFRVYDMEGNIKAELLLPDPEHIYDQQFMRGETEDWLEVIWYDGTVRGYSARDGTLQFETRREAPKENLYEEFYTSRYRIASSLHNAPEVYDIQTGHLVAALEKDSYLTYVTEVGDYMITEYISASGERYGILLNQEFQTLAYLPNLCDIVGEMLIFDYPSGDLRQCRLYSLEELLTIGESYEED